MLKNVSTVMGFTLMSRVLGFLRDIFIARDDELLSYL